MKVVSLDRIYQLVIVALILLLLWKWNCAGGRSCPPITTTIKTDTLWKEQPKDSSNWSKPEPAKVTTGKIPEPRIVIREVPGQAPDTFFVDVDTGAILADYYARADYDTTYKFPGGNIQVQNVVFQNRLQLQRVLPTFNTMEVTTTITKAEKKRRQFFLGLNGYGGKQYPLYGAGLSITYKDRKDRMYEVGPVLFKDQPVMIQAGAKFLISFK